ncbi:hypothetical protein CR513_14903, partial [Mucuna pruriens]
MQKLNSCKRFPMPDGCLMYDMIFLKLDLTHVMSQVCKFISKSEISTTEVKYMEVIVIVKEALCLIGLTKELGIQQDKVQLHCDSQGVIYLAKNQVYHARIKYINVTFHTLLRMHVIDMLTKLVITNKKNNRIMFPFNTIVFSFRMIV